MRYPFYCPKCDGVMMKREIGYLFCGLSIGSISDFYNKGLRHSDRFSN